MHFFHHHNKKEKIVEDDGVTKRKINVKEHDDKYGNLKKEKVSISEKRSSHGAHMLNVPVSGGEVLEVCPGSATSANALAAGEEDETIVLRRGSASRLSGVASAGTGGAGSSADSFGSTSLASVCAEGGSTSTYSNGIKTTRIISSEPARIIRAEIKPEVHVMKQSGCSTECASSAKSTGACEEGNVNKETHLHRESLNADGSITEEELVIKTCEEVPEKKSDVKTNTHVNYIPMGRPKAHERLSPAAGSQSVDHLEDKLEEK
eukprot:CAMPEP_0117439272 /NCGR_PEP_ID=MMETSP0759-20121206/2481_1 /TAXON_ID=63605 /ORGANISM="Percolomonas cosmopolitus, Strain WS" /LENGTH=262 /DNA_ID=CAMNT_0005230985 /DNA_START=59 /DNA_END=847 /DNA_ORIENTATION=+